MITHSDPRGFSLAELIVVIALSGLIGATAVAAILNQQRFQRDAREVLDTRQGVRDAMEVLATDIRGSSSADTIRLMADSALELFTSIGASVVCRKVSATAITLASESGSGNTLSSFLTTPDTGDIALVFRHATGDADGRWDRHRIVAFAPTPRALGCLVDEGDPAEGFVLTVQDPLNALPGRGAPVRFVRRGRYSLYRSSDRKWYLGYRRCNALGPSVCGAIQPISGPYLGHSTDETRTGFLFEYFDTLGNEVSGAESLLSIARIDITARAETARLGRATADSELESGTASVAVRNR
ncbi:MAG TPA: type II secretion system protein [Gemmatimonadaceae bacterium]|nr:type II secretion system protein [Gemmatimonadaceae bacterium]